MLFELKKLFLFRNAHICSPDFDSSGVYVSKICLDFQQSGKQFFFEEEEGGKEIILVKSSHTH